jgi:transcriptional regulator with XRE-family HTH domain
MAYSAIHRSNVKAIRELTGLSQEQLAQLLGTSWVSISRWERKVTKPSRASERRLVRLRELLERIGRALPRREVPAFLRTPHPLLRGYRPIDLLDSDYSFRDLLAFVDAAKSGDMA